MSSNKYPMVETAVPSSDPNWNYNDPKHIWERDHFLICVKAGLKAAQQKIISCAWVSAITGVQWETHYLSGKAKRGPPKVSQSGLRLLWGTGDFKGQIHVPVCIRYQDKVTTATATGPCCLFRWSRQPPIPFITENRRGRPRPGKGRKENRQDMPRCWLPSREALWQTLSPWRSRHEADA